MIYDVLIVGAGVTGGMLARELSKYRLDICLLEKENDVSCGASKANSGIIHGGYDPVPGTQKARLNIAGVPLLYEAAKQLNVPVLNNGSLVAAFGKEEERVLEKLYQRGLENGVAGMAILSGEEARALEPNLSPEITGVLFVPSAGIICPYELTIAAVGNAMDNGVTLKCNFEVTEIKKKDGLFTVKAKNGTFVTGKYLVNCAGAYSDKIAEMADDKFFEIIPRAGEYMLLDKTEGTRVSHTIFQVPTKEGKGILVTPTVDGNLLTGPTANAVAAPDEKQTTPSGMETVLRLAAKSVPTISFRQVITSFCGVRASEKNGDFIIEASKQIPALVHVAAIDSPGLSSCVSIAKMVVNILGRNGLKLCLRDDWNGKREDPHAFRKMNDDEKNEYIKKHPQYGKIVCRCETVSEGEICDAIRRNPPAHDIDGMKRRTRSGMGRCQGGFCAPYVMKLLARENGTSMEMITKKGGNSTMINGRL